MSKDDKYFQFPLAALAINGPWRHVSEGIISYCIYDAFLAEEEGDNAVRRDAATSKLGVTVGNWDASEERHCSITEFLSRVPYTGNGDAVVRIAKGQLFDTRDGNGLDEREFKTLCAVYSAIGAKEMRRITIDEIQRRAAGCVSKALFESWKHRGTVYTTKQLRSTLDELHLRGCFARATYARRLTYFSIRKPAADLRTAIIEKHTKRAGKLNAEHAADAAMTSKVTALTSKGNSRATQGQL
jgi:hypothetical protein